MKKKAVLIVGMHRSGTSAVAGALSYLGLGLGRNLLPASPANEKGFFESMDLIDIHEAILSSLGSSWDSVRPLPPDWWRSSDLEPFKRQIRDIILRDFGDCDVFAVKDPRLCRLLPLWQEILDDLQIAGYFIIPVRNPLEVAQSLMKRDDFSMEKGALLWTLYNLEAERYTRLHCRIIISYDEFLKRPDHFIDAVAEHFNIGDSRSVQKALPEIRRFLEPSLRHHRVDPAVQAERLPGFISSFHRLLRNLSGSANGVKDATDDIYEMVAEVTHIFNFFYASDLRNQLSNAVDLKSELERTQQNFLESASQCKRTEAQLRYMEQVVRLMEASISWRVTAPLRFAKARLIAMTEKAG